jgi:hypothetical protein
MQVYMNREIIVKKKIDHQRPCRQRLVHTSEKRSHKEPSLTAEIVKNNSVFVFQYVDVFINMPEQPENSKKTERGLTYLAPSIQKTRLAHIWSPNNSNLKK